MRRIAMLAVLTAGSLLAAGVGAGAASAATCSSTDGTTSAAGTTISDCGFETPPVGSGFRAYQYDPVGGSWTFGGSAGITANNTAFNYGNPPAPEGSQQAFIQITGTASQSVSNWQAGTLYTLTMSVARRAQGCSFGACLNEDFEVKLDNQVLGTYTATDTNYVDVPFTFSTTAGSHTLSIVGIDSLGGDNTAFIDNLRLSALPTTTGQCKKSGWQNYGVFKNQGDCVSVVATGGKNAAG
jgi:hypothetical protein